MVPYSFFDLLHFLLISVTVLVTLLLMIYKHNCNQCQREFSSPRPHTKYCSSKCRVNFSRGKTQRAKEIIEKVVGKSKIEADERTFTLQAAELLKNPAIKALVENRGTILSKGFHDHTVLSYKGFIIMIYEKKLQVWKGNLVMNIKLGSPGKKKMVFDKPISEKKEVEHKPLIANPDNPYIKSAGVRSRYKPHSRTFGVGQKHEDL
jgi:hypothetical protein